MKYAVDKEKVLYPDECFQIAGICFYCQNKLGRFAKEKQYGDLIEVKSQELNIPFRRELVAGSNRTDFVFFNKYKKLNFFRKVLSHNQHGTYEIY